jgi:ABC-type transport system involved in multi-copper enzyme maturation permease subunit
MKLLVCLRLELIKIFRQRGTYVAYGILAAVVGLMVWGFHQFGPPNRFQVGHRAGTEMAVGGNLVSGFTVAAHIMEPVFLVLVPMLVAMVVGGLVAAEHRSGVLRTWLCRPVSRLTLFTAKALAGRIFAITLSVFLGLMALGAGFLAFGGGDLIAFGKEGLVILEQSLAWPRLALAYGLAALLMCCISSLALLASVIFENPLVAAGSAVAIIPISGILQSMETFKRLAPYLLTTHMDAWSHAFEAAPKFADFHGALACVAGYCLVPYVLAALIFWRRDVTS